MARQNVSLLAFNRGLISPKSLARVDLDRTRLSAERFENFIPKTQGPLTICPGTIFLGSSHNDTGAEFLEFVASTDDVALLELTNDTGTDLGLMRVWLGSDAHNLSLLERPAVDTTLALSDTGWSNTSTGGAVASGSQNDVIPAMTGATTSGVTVSASSEDSVEGGAAWRAADDSLLSTNWADTGVGEASTLPSWWKVDFGAGTTKAVTSYTLRAHSQAPFNTNMASQWQLIASNFDTGTYATDTGKWFLQDARSGQTGWATSERRSFTTPEGDTGTVTARRYWRLDFLAAGASPLAIAEIEMLTAASAQQVYLQGTAAYFNPLSIGALARREKRVIVSDTGTEHSLAIEVARGPVTLRVGSTQRDDDYISEASLGTGYHNLAFTPQGDFWITLQSDALVDRIVSSLAIGDSGTVEITTPWTAANLDNVRYDQSADVVYGDCNGVRPQKIERRGTGRSWSVVDYAPNDGPFLPSPSSSAKLSVSHFYGNTTLNSDIPFFTADHTGALVRIFYEGQGGQWALGALDAHTDAIEVTGISDTGTTPVDDTGYSDRNLTVGVTGVYDGEITIEKSIEGPESGFKPARAADISSGDDFYGGAFKDTGTFFRKIVDKDDNVTAWYRCRRTDTGVGSGVAIVKINYPYGGVTGIGRITAYNSNTDVDLDVLSRFSDTGTSDNWQQGYWSTARGFPTAVALHGGRLGHAQGGSVFLSESDNYENFDETVEGDAAPIIRTLGSGPVDNIHYMVSLLRLIIGTAGAELAVRSSSLDEPLTADNSGVLPFATQGSANIRALRMDTRAIMVQRSKQRVFMMGPAENTLADYEGFELTLLVPDLLEAGAVSVAIQRQPDTRLHVVRADGTVAILTYEPQEEVIAWSTWSTPNGTVERAAVLPGVSEDAVFYHIKRTINSVDKRYLEKWAKESECIGDTGLSFLVHCAKSYTDTGRTATLTGFSHLAGESVVVWADDTGAAGTNPHMPDAGKDLSPGWSDTGQKTYTVSGAGVITLDEDVHHAVAGIPYDATWVSSKLAYAAQLGTALAQMKRAPQLALSLYRCHKDGLRFGHDTGSGKMDSLPGRQDGAVVDANRIHPALDMVAVPMPSKWDPDTRLILKGRSPRPATILAAIPTIETAEK